MASNSPEPPRSREGGETFVAVHQTPNKIWAACLMVIVGFTVAAVAIPVHSLVMLIAGAVVTLVGTGLALAFGIMDNVH